MRRFLVLLTAALLIVAPATALAAAAAHPAKTVLAIGDSTVEPDAAWDELCRLMWQDADLACDVRNEAVGGTSCSYWPSRIGALLATHQPDIVVLACGTNDQPERTLWGESETTWSWRYTMEAVHNWDPTTAQVAVLIQYSEPKTAPQWVLDSEPTTNDRIYTEYLRHQPWFAIADWQYIPATATYLDSGGLHSTARGARYQGRILYDALALKLGWPASSEPPLCDLYGHRRPYARPAFIPCA